MQNEILVIGEKREEKILRKKAEPFDFSKFSKKEVNDVIVRMRRVMREANGIGLSANQIGLPYAVFVAEVPGAQGENKFYSVFNPRLEKTAGEPVIFEEGCLSIPGKWGNVTRPEQVTVSGFDKTGKPTKIKAWGLLARVFQHEIDHLNGKLFIDRTRDVYGSEKSTPVTEPRNRTANRTTK